MHPLKLHLQFSGIVDTAFLLNLILRRKYLVYGYGYIRVSTDKQSVNNQRYEIERFCRNNKLRIGQWIEETISGVKAPDKRRLGALLNSIKQDDLIVCSELSRLGRSLFMIMSILSHCLEDFKLFY